jgi:hypothetical protein
MSKRSNLVRRSEAARLRLIRSDPLPRWEQLSPERQRELVMLLATLVLKRLPGPGQSQEVESHD